MKHNKEEHDTETKTYIKSLETKIRELAEDLSRSYQCGKIADNKELIKKSQDLDNYIIKYLKETNAQTY